MVQKNEKIYLADRDHFGDEVRVLGEEDVYSLDPKPSQRLKNHSPDGFSWGYGGSGPSQLALAILLDCLVGEARQEEIALRYYQDFKWKFLAVADAHRFRIYESEIRRWIREKKAKDGQ